MNNTQKNITNYKEINEIKETSTSVGVFLILERGEIMAYEGYLIKVGNYKIPHSIIKADTYKVLESVQDIDSFTDNDGILNREVLEHLKPKVEFETKNLLTNTQFAELMSNIRANYTIAKERKAEVTIYIPEKDYYTTQSMYMPDIEPQIYFADSKKIQYNPIRLAFIGY